jgi:hypothetical protein
MRIYIYAIAMVMGITSTYAQSFSGRTNDIVLSFKKPNTTASVLPLISWNSPRLEYANSQLDKVIADAAVSSELTLRSLKLVLTLGDGEKHEKVFDVSNLREFKVTQSITLRDGTNVIELVAENINGGTVSSSRNILYGNAVKKGVSLDRKDYVLMFATDLYDYWNDLVNPVEDARSLAKMLEEKYGFTVELIENPNVDDVFGKLRDYAERKFKPQDQLMIFFAGHGYFDDAFGEGFVVAKNSLMNDKGKTSYISHNRLRQIINNIPVDHVFLAMDVCFGGTFDPVIASNRGQVEVGETTEEEFLVRKLDQRTRKYLTSGGKEYVSDGIPGKHSPFTLRLLEALANGGGSDRILTLSEIKTYVEKMKPQPRLGGFGDDKPDSDFVFVAKN